MKTALDQNTAIYRLLNVAAVTSVITGGIFKGRRPANSDREDIVINTLTLGDGTRQYGVSNVNVYVKDISATIAGTPQLLANSSRLDALTKIIEPILRETDGDDFALWIDRTQLVPEPEVNQHFMNFRIEFRFINYD